MEFIKTISALLEKTEDMYVYAMAAYAKDGSSIGIRATYYGDMKNDPVIANNTFMVCGDIFNHRDWCKIKDMKELKGYLNYTDITSLAVRLRADALTAPTVTEISLGDYLITDYEVQRSDPQTGQIERVKFNLKRIQSSLFK